MFYAAFGITLESEFALPGAVVRSSPGALVPDLRVVAGAVKAGEPQVGPYRLDGAAVVLEAEGVGRFHCDGNVLTVDAAEPQELLLASALPMALWQRGAVMLHGAAVVLPGQSKAVAILGDSGTGKSTLAASLGGALLAEDSIAVDQELLCSGLPGGTWRCEADGTRTFVVAAEQVAEAELGAIVLLGHEVEPALRRLRGAAAFAGLQRNLHRPLAARILGRQALAMQRLARLAREVPVYSYVAHASGAGTAKLFEDLQGLTGD